MDTNLNYQCDYLDVESCSCRYLDEMNMMPSLDEGCQCLECLVALYKSRGCNVAGFEG